MGLSHQKLYKCICSMKDQHEKKNFQILGKTIYIKLGKTCFMIGLTRSLTFLWHKFKVVPEDDDNTTTIIIINISFGSDSSILIQYDITCTQTRQCYNDFLFHIYIYLLTFAYPWVGGGLMGRTVVTGL